MSADSGPFGSRLDRELVDLAMSVNGAVLWSFSFADGVRSVSAGMDALLDMSGASDAEVRARLERLIEPLVVAAREAGVWDDLEVQQPLAVSGESSRWVGFRARRVGESECVGLVGVATDASSPQGDNQVLADLADRYRLLVELSPEAISVHQDGVIKYVNSAAVQMFAATSEESIVGLPLADLVDPGSVSDMWSRLRSLTHTGQSAGPVEAKLTRMDRGVIQVEVVSVRTSWAGRPAYQVIIRDLTERRQAEATWRSQAALVRHVSNAVISTTRSGVVTSWNPAAETVYGVAADDAIGKPVSDVVGSWLHPDEVVAQGGSMEAVHRHADGSALTIRVSVAGMDESYVLVCADETARWRAEQHFATVVATLAEGVIVVGKQGVIESANPAAQNIIGVEGPELIHSAPLTWPIWDEAGVLIPEQDRPFQRARFLGVGDDSRAICVVRPDGRKVWAECTTRALNPGDDPPYAVVLSFTDITERRRQNEVLLYQATHDELTGLLNRKGIHDYIAGLPRQPRNMGVVFCDIDNFKRINESLGHQAGDELLATLGRRLSNGLPEHCQAARLNGDEFVVLCNDLTSIGGLDRLLDWVTTFLHTVVPVRDQLVHVSASTGAATLNDTMAGDDLLRYADAALDHAKSKGPGHSVLATPDLLASATDQLRLEDELRTALDTDQLTLHYQPITTHNGHIVMVEALLRWPHPHRGLLSPGVILPVAEQAGLTHDLDQWVLRTAMHQAAHWPETVSVTINLGAFTPDDPDFTNTITTLLQQAHLPAHRLVLEMVETALVDLSDRSHTAMTSLSETGVRFALDDFGTGYSSLARLKDLPTHILKLDRRFVANLEHDPRDRAIAHAVINLAHALGHHCIAEGIETPQQHHLLHTLHTDLYQGFHLHHPLPPEQLPI